MNNTRLYMLGFALSALLILSACGGSGDKNGNAAPSSPAAESSAPGDDTQGQGATKNITIDAKNFEFDQKEIKVNKGDTVNITLKNTQGNHGIKIDGYDQTIKGGDTVTFTADKAGEFKFECNIMCGQGHAKMTGTLIVA